MAVIQSELAQGGRSLGVRAPQPRNNAVTRELVGFRQAGELMAPRQWQFKLPERIVIGVTPCQSFRRSISSRS